MGAMENFGMTGFCLVSVNWGLSISRAADYPGREGSVDDPILTVRGKFVHYNLSKVRLKSEGGFGRRVQRKIQSMRSMQGVPEHWENPVCPRPEY